MFPACRHLFCKALLFAVVLGFVAALPPLALAKPKADLPKTAVEAYNQGIYFFQLAQGQAERGNYSGQTDLVKQSLVYFQHAERLNPLLPEALSNQGFAYLTLKQYNKAITAFNKALALNPQHLNSLNGLATAQSLVGKPTEALATLNTLTTLAPGDPQYWFNQGAILQQAQRPAEAEAAYKQALKVAPEHQRTWFNLATLYENQHRFEDALAAYKKTKQIDVANPIGLEALHRLDAIQQAQTTAPGPQGAS